MRAGRPRGSTDGHWPARLVLLLNTIRSIQQRQHTVSIRELEEVCGVSRQSIHNWLLIAQGMGFVDLHDGLPRGLQLLPKGRKLADKFATLPTMDAWKCMRQELRKETHEYQRTHDEPIGTDE